MNNKQMQAELAHDALESSWSHLKPITRVTWTQRLVDLVTIIVIAAAAVELLNIAVQWAFKVKLF